MLTPEEFVSAGDHLVYHCPTWSWSAGEPGRKKAYLPPDKQFLVTKNGRPAMIELLYVSYYTHPAYVSRLETTFSKMQTIHIPFHICCLSF